MRSHAASEGKPRAALACQGRETDEAVLYGISNRRRWTLVVLMTLSAVINYLDRATISVALPKIAHDFALSPTAKGLVLSSFFWCYTAIQIPVGVLVDRCRVRWLYAGAFAMWSMACGLTGFVGGMATLVLMRVLLGIGEAVLLPANLKVVNILFAPRDRGLPTGLCTGGTRLGLALGAPLVAWLTVRYGWRLMFAIVGFSAFVWLLPWVLAYPGRSSAGAAAGERPAARSGRRGWGFTIDRNLVGCCLGYFSFGYYQYMLMTWLPDYFVQVRHFQLLRAGVYSALSYLIWGVGAAAGGWLGDSLIRRGWSEPGVRKGLVTASFATGALLIPCVRAAHASTAMAWLAGASLVGLSSANALVILQDCAPLGEVGAWAGVANFIGNLGGVLSPLLTGILISRTGAYFPGFALSTGVLLAGILPYWFLVGDLRTAELRSAPARR